MVIVPVGIGPGQMFNIQVPAPVHQQAVLPQPSAQPIYQQEAGRWQDGVMDCCSEGCSPCCHAWCCPCFSYANTVSSIKAHMPIAGSSWARNLLLFVVVGSIGHACSNMANKHLTENVDWNNNFNTTFWQQISANQQDPQYQLPYYIAATCSLLILLLVAMLRKKFRNKFAIPGDDCQDCCCAMCCSPCVLSQMDRHLGTSRQGGCVFSDPAIRIPPVEVAATTHNNTQPAVIRTADVTLV